ncbi:heme peroxidase [Rhexocercosporidium sp. MPI-PUGE-AT-0058]|nr:heme peroxidase [Rhexocercosporidium sp. MPI-PUGE-AT-0058]
MLGFILLTILLQVTGNAAQALDSNGLSLADKVLAIERLLLTPGTIIFPVTPCNLTLNGPPADISGAQTAAQWVRTVFHDFITADVAAGTGGLDGSISFEADRDENLGLVFSTMSAPRQSFINETIMAFNLFSTLEVSTADFIALGLAVSLLSCDPSKRMIKLRAGRIDATKAGPTGVPRAEDPFDKSNTTFAKAGFNTKEMIQSIACGHTIGGVHRRNHPEIVLDNVVMGPGPEMDGADTFDSTPFVYENKVVQEYLSAKGKAGGPLVTTKNETFRTDFRIFNSDKNATIKAMSAPQDFQDTCFTVFEKMMDTVPRGMKLSDPIMPRQWIPIESHLDLSPTGQVQYSGNISTYSRNGIPINATYYYGKAGGGNTGYPMYSKGPQIQSNIVNHVVSDPFGDIAYYPFNDTLPSPLVNSFNIQDVNRKDVYKEAINLNIFVLPSQTFLDDSTPRRPRYIVRAALLTTLSPAGTQLTGIFYYGATQPNSVAPKYTQVKFTMTSFKKLGSYTIFQGVVAQPTDLASGGGGRSVDVMLGMTQRSVKTNLGSFRTGFFGFCTKADMTKC